jgi:hypothetical protein
MSNKIILKKSSVAAKVPLTTDLVYGELALNYADGKLYFKTATNEVQSFYASDPPLVLSDISPLCDGSRAVFDLKSNQTLISSTYIVDSKDVEVTVDGRQLRPYVKQEVSPWISDYDNQGSRSFRVRGNQLIIYNAPDVGSYVSVILKKSSAVPQVQRYPFSTTAIALGD